MIIPDSFRTQYDATLKIWEPIKYEVDGILQSICSDIHYATFDSRIKPVESVFLKAHKGDYLNPFKEMEDYFACELVVPLTSQLGLVLDKIIEDFEITEQTQRPRQPYDFRYSGKHFLLRLKDSPMRSDKSVLDKEFEIQIKTYLQSAWQFAGHNIIYKPNRISYWTERIAGQLRGLLELADSVLAQIEQTANLLHNQSNEEENNYKPNQKRIISLMVDNFEEKKLPGDKRRMAVIVQNYLDIGGFSVEQLEDLIYQAKEQSNPVLDYLTINPIEQVFILIYQQNEDRILRIFEKGSHRVLITPEMEDFFPALKTLSENGRTILG